MDNVKMGRKAKAVVKQKKTPATQSNKKTSKSAIKKIKDFERCREWLLEQKNIPHESVPNHEINDDENSEYDNELYRKIEPEEKPRVGRRMCLC